MIESSSFIFITPLWLLMLPPLWTLATFYLFYRARISSWADVCESRLLNLLARNRGKNRKTLTPALIIFPLLTLAVVALAGPSWEKQSYPLLESAAARVIIIDLSQSMLVEDVRPNRLSLAGAAAGQLIQSDFDGETGLVVFAGAAFVVSPLTRDGNTLLEFIKVLQPSTMPVGGSRLDLAIDQARQLLEASVSRTGQILVITDGASPSDYAVQAASDAQLSGNQIAIIGIGTEAGGPIKHNDGGLLKNSEGDYVLARLNISELEAIARAGQGTMTLLSSGASTPSLAMPEFAGGNPGELQNREDSPQDAPINRGVWFLWLMLPLCLLLFRRNLMLLVVISLLPVITNDNQAIATNLSWLNDEQQAHQAFRQQQFDQVDLWSTDALLLGAAAFRAGRYEAAQMYYAKTDSAIAHYNRANALVFQGELESALLAYRQALERDPGLFDASYNHALLLDYLSDPNNADSAADNNDNEDDSEQSAADNEEDARIGESELSQESRDAGDLAGIGASLQLERGRVKADEDFSAGETELMQFLQRLQSEDFEPEVEQIELWTQSLVADPSELFRRKFLRDYKRRQQQAR